MVIDKTLGVSDSLCRVIALQGYNTLHSFIPLRLFLGPGLGESLDQNELYDASSLC